VTLEQARLWCGRIDERRRRRLAVESQANRLAFAAAFAKENAKVFSEFVGRLLERKPAEPEIGTMRAPDELASRLRAERAARGPNPAVVEALRKKREAEAGKDDDAR
jgi:hypothetical protein